jgi:hypothetical protein
VGFGFLPALIATEVDSHIRNMKLDTMFWPYSCMPHSGYFGFQSIEDFAMQDNYCPYCTGEILEAVFLCKQCGRDLHAIRIANLKAESASNTEQYQIVPDGTDFGIAFRGEVISMA